MVRVVLEGTLDELVEVPHRLFLERLARIEMIVVVKLVETAMDAIAAGLENHIGDRTTGASEFRLIIAGTDVNVLERLNRRDQNSQKSGAMVVVDALKLAQGIGLADWVAVDATKMEGIFKKAPDRDQYGAEIKEALIVELYSR